MPTEPTEETTGQETKSKTRADTRTETHRDWNNGLKSEPVTTYVDGETKEAWKEHADNLDVTLSRFIEMMVEAGRSVYSDSAPEGRESSDLASAKKKIKALEDRLSEKESHPEAGDAFEVYRALGDEHSKLGEITEEVESNEDEVYEALQLLMDEDLVEYDPMRNAYSRNQERVEGG